MTFVLYIALGSVFKKHNVGLKATSLKNVTAGNKEPVLTAGMGCHRIQGTSLSWEVLSLWWEALMDSPLNWEVHTLSHVHSLPQRHTPSHTNTQLCWVDKGMVWWSELQSLSILLCCCSVRYQWEFRNTVLYIFWKHVFLHAGRVTRLSLQP